MDAFTCSWADDNNWLCPPIYLVPRVLRHAQNTKAQGTLIVPLWMSFPFWPLLFPDGLRPAGFVQELVELPIYHSLFLPGSAG